MLEHSGTSVNLGTQMHMDKSKIQGRVYASNDIRFGSVDSTNAKKWRFFVGPHILRSSKYFSFIF